MGSACCNLKGICALFRKKWWLGGKCTEKARIQPLIGYICAKNQGLSTGHDRGLWCGWPHGDNVGPMLAWWWVVMCSLTQTIMHDFCQPEENYSPHRNVAVVIIFPYYKTQRDLIAALENKTHFKKCSKEMFSRENCWDWQKGEGQSTGWVDFHYSGFKYTCCSADTKIQSIMILLYFK